MRFLSVLLVVVAITPLSPAKEEFQAGDFVKRHLHSIGEEPARAAVKNRLAQGAVTFRVVLGRVPQSWNGEQTLASEDSKLASLLKFPPSVYRTERFVSDGRKTSVAQASPGNWTVLGRFVMVHNEILKEGLWGGTLSTGWALSRWEGSGAKLRDGGFKTIDGQQLHRVVYVPRKGSDLTIELYFEPDTFRHVMTVYSLTITGSLDPNAPASETEGETRYQLEERFSDFKDIDHLTLPGRWTIQFSYGMQSPVSISRYDVVEEKISHNVSLDPKSFELK
ncbi:MAG TPA: hypothetical protein VK466_06910 [Terriglobales bacterium]|nr:hypothetical protein [Terriglobales bacterium]